MQSYSLEGSQDLVKVPAGRLLDNLGTFIKHALIVVTNGKATGEEVLAFTQEMWADVQQHYGIHLELEVNLVS